MNQYLSTNSKTNIAVDYVDLGASFYIYFAGYPLSTKTSFLDDPDLIIFEEDIMLNLTDIDIIQELQKPTTASLNFSYTVGNKLLPIPFINPEPIYKKVTELRRILIKFEYRNFKNKLMMPLVPAFKKTTTEIRKHTFDIYEAKLDDIYYVQLPNDFLIFAGMVSKPIGAGNNNSFININIQCTNSFTHNKYSYFKIESINDEFNKEHIKLLKSLGDVNTLEEYYKAIIKFFIKSCPPLLNKQDQKFEIEEVSGREYLEFAFSSNIKDDSNQSYLYVLKLNNIPLLYFNFKNLFNKKENTQLINTIINEQNLKNKQNVFFNNTNTIVYKNYYDFIDKICTTFNLDYTITFNQKNGLEILNFRKRSFDMIMNNDILEKFVINQPNNVISENPISSQPDFYAFRLLYGEMVLNFQYQCSSFPTGNGGSTVIEKTENNKIILGTYDEKGIYFQTVIDEKQIRDWVKAHSGFSAITDAIEFARQNADAFIAYFVKIDPSVKPTKPPTTGAGRLGESLTMELRWGIPYLVPGMLIYFDSANKELFPLPPSWTGFYTIQKIQNKLNSKENTWVQTIEAVR